MVHAVGWGDLDHFSEEEELLSTRPLAEVAARCAARVAIEVEESEAVASVRPTVPVFAGEPWC
jgi:hypothetical protein